jgi:hypothetical protein
LCRANEASGGFNLPSERGCHCKDWPGCGGDLTERLQPARRDFMPRMRG